MNYQINYAYKHISMDSIKLISDTADPELNTDIFGKYLDNNVTDNKNIGRILFQTLYRNDPGRFKVENGLVANTTKQQRIPLVIGDKLQFIITLKPNASQSDISNPNPGSFPNGQNVTTLTRKYLIEFVLSN